MLLLLLLGLVAFDDEWLLLLTGLLALLLELFAELLKSKRSRKSPLGMDRPGLLDLDLLDLVLDGDGLLDLLVAVGLLDLLAVGGFVGVGIGGVVSGLFVGVPGGGMVMVGVGGDVSPANAGQNSSRAGSSSS